jgi:hypothetical protein
MDPEYIELRGLIDLIRLKLDFDLTPDDIAKIDQDFPEAEREAEKLKLKEKIYKERLDRIKLLASILTLRYNLDYKILLSFLKRYDNLLDIDMMEKRINDVDLTNMNIDVSEEIENFYYHYYFHYYKIILEKIQDEILLNLVKSKILLLGNISEKGIKYIEVDEDNYFLTNIYGLVDKEVYNKELLNKYNNFLKGYFEGDEREGFNIYTKVKVSLPEIKNIFRNKSVNHGFNKGNFCYIPIKGFRNREPTIINVGQTYKYKGDTIVADREMIIYPIKRLSKFILIPREITFSYSHNFLGFNMERINILKRLNEINASHEFLKKLLFTLLVDYILLFISDLTEQLKQRNIGLLITGGFAYRHYNYSYITEDIDILLGNLVDDKISIKPLENYREIFQFIIDYFNVIKQKDFKNEIIIRIIKKFFKDIKNMGINLSQFDNINQFYQQLERDNVNIEIFLSPPPHNDKILKLTVVLNEINRYAYADININDKTKAINTLSSIRQINPYFIQDGISRFQFNVDDFYLTLRDQIENTFYPTMTSVNVLYDSASILNVMDLNYIIYEKNYLINKLMNNLLFGIIPNDFPVERLEVERQRFLDKFSKLLITHNEFNNFMATNPSPLAIQNFKTFIG